MTLQTMNVAVLDVNGLQHVYQGLLSTQNRVNNIVLSLFLIVY